MGSWCIGSSLTFRKEMVIISLRMARTPRSAKPLFCTKGVAMDSFTACIYYRDGGLKWLKVHTNDLLLRTAVEFQQVYLRNKSMSVGTVEYKKNFAGFKNMLI